MAKEYDWTVDPISHRSNSSPFFQLLTDQVDNLLVNSARDLVTGRTKSVAGLILAQLTHKYGFAPTKSFGQILTELGYADTEGIESAPSQEETT